MAEIYDIRDFDIWDIAPHSEEQEVDWDDFLSELPYEQSRGIDEIVDTVPDYRERQV